MRRSRKRSIAEVLRCLSVACCMLLLAGCLELPIRQRLRLAFGEDGGLRITLRVELGDDRSESSLGERLRREEQALLRGEDPWQSRFEALQGDVEELSWRKEDGLLRRYVRSSDVSREALVEPESPLARFFADTPNLPVYTWDEIAGVAELALYPGTPDRATRREARRIDGYLGRWSEHLLAYLRSLDRLYTYLGTRPERAAVCFGEIIGNDLELPPPTAEEQGLTEAVTDRIVDALAIFEVEEREAESLEEISRRVFDPFPAEIAVTLPAAPLEVEGFEVAGDNLVVPGLSLWSALRRSEGRWASPDPLLILGGAWLAGEEEVDVEAVAGMPRRAEVPPAGSEIEDELRASLSPAGVYRVTWSWRPDVGE